MKLLFFLDIDGTLILENQKPNTHKLSLFLKRFKNNRQILFGLNSNRSIQDIKPIYKQFNLNGPVIAENGIYFKKNLNSKAILLIKKPPQLLPEITKKTLREFCQKSGEPIIFKITDTVKALAKIKQNKGKIILMNKFRKFTTSLHIFNQGKRDVVFARQVKRYLKKSNLSRKLKVEVKISEVFSNILIQSKLIDKGEALIKLRRYYPDYRFITIGDDESDLRVMKNVDLVCAVGNATAKFKKSAHLVAKQPYTKGVLEIIKHCLKARIIYF